MSMLGLGFCNWNKRPENSDPALRTCIIEFHNYKNPDHHIPSYLPKGVGRTNPAVQFVTRADGIRNQTRVK
jgi:hypothetical protein